MKASDLIIGKKYKDTAFARRVRLVSIKEIGPDGYASVIVEYYGKLYWSASFRMSE